MFRNLVATSCMGWAEIKLQDNNNNSDRADLNRGFRDKNSQGFERSPWRGYGGDCSKGCKRKARERQIRVDPAVSRYANISIPLRTETPPSRCTLHGIYGHIGQQSASTSGLSCDLDSLKTEDREQRRRRSRRRRKDDNEVSKRSWRAAEPGFIAQVTFSPKKEAFAWAGSWHVGQEKGKTGSRHPARSPGRVLRCLELIAGVAIT
ncbi:hypothetical protein TESG_07439 [Trichophyton tonsurans CBS 112818]|uniref:Uncharacterized protein n=1 Tax=Trichophyton tonsurans (strain CBS 112818) TaxID=647933 RepID=F2S967_TRIT1|nr:hypothetical protein TESG_07439 [Trichophyton tonsurans CBS 112818]